MQRTNSQKVIRVTSIFSILVSILAFLVSIMFIASGGLIASANTQEVASLVQTTGMTVSQLTAIVSMVGGGAFVLGVLHMALGVCGLRAANDASKIKPVWVLSIIAALVNLGALVIDVFSGVPADSLVSSVATACIAAVMVYAAYNVKRDARALNMA